MLLSGDEFVTVSSLCFDPPLQPEFHISPVVSKEVTTFAFFFQKDQCVPNGATLINVFFCDVFASVSRGPSLLRLLGPSPKGPMRPSGSDSKTELLAHPAPPSSLLSWATARDGECLPRFHWCGAHPGVRVGEICAQCGARQSEKLTGVEKIHAPSHLQQLAQSFPTSADMQTGCGLP